jgi:hypothetical protein
MAQNDEFPKTPDINSWVSNEQLLATQNLSAFDILILESVADAINQEGGDDKESLAEEITIEVATTLEMIGVGEDTDLSDILALNNRSRPVVEVFSDDIDSEKLPKTHKWTLKNYDGYLEWTPDTIKVAASRWDVLVQPGEPESYELSAPEGTLIDRDDYGTIVPKARSTRFTRDKTSGGVVYAGHSYLRNSGSGILDSEAGKIIEAAFRKETRTLIDTLVSGLAEYEPSEIAVASIGDVDLSRLKKDGGVYAKKLEYIAESKKAAAQRSDRKEEQYRRLIAQFASENAQKLDDYWAEKVPSTTAVESSWAIIFTDLEEAGVKTELLSNDLEFIGIEREPNDTTPVQLPFTREGGDDANHAIMLGGGAVVVASMNGAGEVSLYNPLKAREIANALKQLGLEIGLTIGDEQAMKIGKDHATVNLGKNPDVTLGVGVPPSEAESADASSVLPKTRTISRRQARISCVDNNVFISNVSSNLPIGISTIPKLLS